MRVQVHLLKPIGTGLHTERMSLQSKIEAVIYASEEPVTLQQLVGLLAEEAQAELDSIASSGGRPGMLACDRAGSGHARCTRVRPARQSV